MGEGPRGERKKNRGPVVGGEGSGEEGCVTGTVKREEIPVNAAFANIFGLSIPLH